MAGRPVPAEGVAFRTPLLPFAALSGLTGGAARRAWEAGGGLSAGLTAAVAADLAHLDAGLRALVADPLVRAALALASPSLDAALDRWLASPAAPPPRALLAYAGRLAARCTPYGLSAGCAGGAAAGEAAYRLAPRSALRVAARLDVAVGARLADALAADPETRDTLTFVPNSTLYAAADRLRFVERARDGDGSRYHPVAVEEDDALRAVLDAARDGARLPDLARGLTGDGVAYDEAYGFVTELVEAQLLVPDVPVVTGDPAPLYALGGLAGAAGAAAALSEGATPERLRQAVAAARAADVALPPGRAVHVDVSRPGTFVLGDAVVAEARRAVDVLLPLFRPAPVDEDLARFAQAFTARYGAAEVPLLEALDEEVGVGFGPPAAMAAAGAPLLAGLTPPPPTEGPAWTPVDHHLVDILSRALRDGAAEVDLGPADLGPLRNQHDPRPLPDAFAVVGTVAAASAAAVARGAFRLVVHGVAGPPGVRLLSRFAGLDPAVDALVRGHVAREEALRPAAVFAEVVHLPDRAAANAAVRPALRAHEIPLLAASALPPASRIVPADLLVSVVEGRVVLRSERLGREVLPRLTAAHDHRLSALPAYRFLGAVQQDGVAGLLRWSWGQVQSAPYLPRVVAGRLVLARAQWRWFRADLAELAAARTTEAAYAAVQRLRDAWRVPRWVTVVRGEQELAVDLDGVGAGALLARAARRGGQLILREQLPGPDELCLAGPEGAFAHEFVLPCTVPSPAPRPAARARPRPAAYVPGSGWLSVRLPTGVATADGVLREVVAPLVAGCEQWSYDRVAEPGACLRLRLRGDPLALLPALRERVAPLVASGRVGDVLLDTYRSPGEAAERLAHADSVAALRVLAAGDDLDARWRAALWGVDRLLADAGLDDPGRLAAVRRMRDRLLAAYGATGARAVRLAGRVHRAAPPGAPEPWLATVLDARSAVVAPLLAASSADELDALCGAHVNRLLRAVPGVQQLVLADLLGRRYQALLATRRRGAGTYAP